MRPAMQLEAAPAAPQSARGPRRSGSLKRERLSDQLIVELLADIVSGLYPPGAPFASEGEMVERFSISRVVARESLRMLGSINVIAAQQGRRAVVRPWTEWDLFSPLVAQAFQDAAPPHDLLVQLYDTRGIVEGGAAALSALSSSVEQATRIQEIAVRLADLSGRRVEAERFLTLDRAFHDAVAQAAGNAPLRALLETLFTLTRRQWSVGGIRLQRQTLPTVAAQHQAVAAAIAARDPLAARRAMEEHIAWAKENDTGRR